MYFYGYRQHQPHAFVNKLNYNASTVTGENIRYLMSKYGIYEHEWYQPTCTIYNCSNVVVSVQFRNGILLRTQ